MALCGHRDAQKVLFIATWCIAIDRSRTIARLLDLAQDAACSVLDRSHALLKLGPLAPKDVLRLLVQGNLNWDPRRALRALELILSSEEEEFDVDDIHEILHKGSQHAQWAATVILASRGDAEAAERLRPWFVDLLDGCTSDAIQREAIKLVRRAPVLLQSERVLGHIRHIDAEAPGFGKKILLAGAHPAGLALLLEELKSASPDDMFLPMVQAITTYGRASIGVVEGCLARGNDRLLARLEDLARSVWPGLSLVEIANLARSEGTSPARARPTPEEAKEPSTRRGLRIERDAMLVRRVKEAEAHKCQICDRTLKSAPHGELYSEVHHVYPLGHGGPDSDDNVLCLCPLCHRMMHLGLVGIDANYRIVRAPELTEPTRANLRLSPGRQIMIEALRYHWTVLFGAPADQEFDIEDDPE